MIETKMPGGNPGKCPSGSTYVTMTVGGQLCGIAVTNVRDIIETRAMTRIPLASPEIIGSLNLRGRIVTAIDLRRRLGLSPHEKGQTRMSVIVEQEGGLYCLVVDSVWEVMNFDDQRLEPNPPTLGSKWQDLSAGIYRLPSELLVILDTERVLAVT